jgi:inner membrane protein
MTGRTHDLAAFTVLGVVALTHPLPHMTLATGLVAIAANLLGGIAPDIDQPTAPFWRNLPVGRIFGKVFHMLAGGHRFLSHSVLGVILFGVGWHFLLQVLTPSFPHLDMHVIWWAFMIGFVSHLVMDMFTREGVPWLLPIPVKFGLPPIKMLRVVTGGFIERFVVFPGLFLVNALFYFLYYGELVELLHKNLR